MISSPHLATAFLFDMLRRWSLYLNRCVAALVSESLDAPGPNKLFLLEPTLVDIEGGRYIGTILPASLADLVAKTGSRGGSGSSGEGGNGGRGGSGNDGSGGGGGGTISKKRKASPTGGSARVQVCYDAHLPALSLWDGENLRSILAGTFFPTLHVTVI